MRRLFAVAVLLLGTTAALAQGNVFQYFAAINGAQAGPFTIEEVSAQIAAGKVGPETLVWHAGMADWAPAKSVEELVVAFAPPPLPASAVTPPPLPGSTIAPAAATQREAMLEVFTIMFEAQGTAGAAPGQVAALVSCYTDMALTFSPAEQQVLLDGNGHPPQEQMIAISKAHPELEAMQMECGRKAQAAK